MPQKQSSRRKKVAEELVRGKAVTAIAAELGASRATVTRDVASLEVRQVVAQLTAQYHAQMEELFLDTIAVIKDAMTARKTAVSKLATKPLNARKNSQRIELVIDLGVDHYARLTAAKRSIELLTAGKPIPKAPEPSADDKPVTLDQIRMLLHAEKPHADLTLPQKAPPRSRSGKK